ncbi:MAG: Gfo/Idh/MocA family oxidoreductase [Lachnospiraceae bacterium]|nr:Gfo/Idh/MocA family oxidoreductase [Lachnospiraceae bacterium]
MKVAIIGTGVGIRTHLVGIRKCKDAIVVGVVGRSLDRTAETLMAAGENPQLAMEWNALLNTNPDIICITTPIPEREQYYQTLQNYQGHLLIEKPILTNSKDAEKIKSYISLCYNQSYTDFQLRGLKAFQTIKAWLRAGRIGKPYYISIYERTSAVRKQVLSEWQYSFQTGGGQIFSMGSHLLDLSVFLLGLTYTDMKQARTWINTAIPNGEWYNKNIEAPSDEFCAINVRLDDYYFELKSSAISVGERTFNLLIEGTEGTIEFIYRYGETHCTLWEAGDKHKVFYLGKDGDFSEEKIDGLNPSIFRLAYPGYFNDIISKIQTGEGTTLASIQDGIANTEIIENAEIVRTDNIE